MLFRCSPTVLSFSSARSFSIMLQFLRSPWTKCQILGGCQPRPSTASKSIECFKIGSANSLPLETQDSWIDYGLLTVETDYRDSTNVSIKRWHEWGKSSPNYSVGRNSNLDQTNVRMNVEKSKDGSFIGKRPLAKPETMVQNRTFWTRATEEKIEMLQNERPTPEPLLWFQVETSTLNIEKLQSAELQ